MVERAPSRTAQGVAIYRAVHQFLDDEPKILDDPIGPRLLDPAVIQAIRERYEQFQEPRARALRTHLLVRSRFCEDCLAEAVRHGLDQYVILGSGMDTFAYRQPDWARWIRIFEVDHPASQQNKRDMLTQAGISIPSNLEYIPIDFESDSFETGLARSSIDLNRPVFFAWLGVTMYLSREAVDQIMRTIGSLAKNTELVLTFSQPRESVSAAEIRAGQAGEPWLSHFKPDEIEQKLEAAGFSRVDFLTPEETYRRYLVGRGDGLFVTHRITIASARV